MTACSTGRRFAIIKIDREVLWQSTVLGWGQAIGDQVFVDYLDYTMRTSMAALEEWHAAIRPEVDARVVWID
jgi:hypothetical protein